MAAPKEISLLPQEENLNSSTAKFLHWATTVGRYVIVFTELIVICAFISRFWLDRENADLSEVIRQQKAILETTETFEKDFSMLRKRLDKIKLFYAQQPPYDQNLLSLVKSTPPQIIYDSLVVGHDEDNHVSVTATLSSSSETAIVDFITNLILNPNVQKVDVKNIEKKPKSDTYSINLFLIFELKEKDQA